MKLDTKKSVQKLFKRFCEEEMKDEEALTEQKPSEH